uniref:PTTG1 interacting protein n=1 Tax=Oryzias sinensis TaxID=183150 RepID=A0A8C7X5B0_9TELE
MFFSFSLLNLQKLRQLRPACKGKHRCGSCCVLLCLQCLWCITTKNCSDYPVTWLLPPHSLCSLAEARWGVCWLNFEALIITLAVLGGCILISITVCCCCCCCGCRKRRSSRRTPKRDEEQLLLQTDWRCGEKPLLTDSGSCRSEVSHHPSGQIA